MKLLLDTSALIWSLSQSGRLSGAARAAIEDEANSVHVSVVSVWEIEIKVAKRKLKPPSDLRSALAGQHFQTLPVAPKHVLAVEALPRHHRDPFDRMLVAQAQLEGMTLVTADPVLQRYPVATLSAS